MEMNNISETLKNKKIGFCLIFISILLLTACGGEPDNIEPLDVKEYESDLNKDDLNIVGDKGDWETPIESGEFLGLKGKIHTEKHGSDDGEISLGVKRVLRGDAAKYRVKDKYREDIEEDEEWIIVELEVYNWGIENKDKLTFLPDDIRLFYEDGEDLKVEDVGLDTDYKRVAVYEGKEEVVSVTSKVKEDSRVLVGTDKLIEEKEDEKSEEEKEEVVCVKNKVKEDSRVLVGTDKLIEEKEDEKSEEENTGEDKDLDEKIEEELDEDSNNEENEEEETEEEKDKEDDEEELELSDFRFLTTDDVYTIEEFKPEDDEEDKNLEDLSEEQEKKDKKKEEDKKDDTEGEDKNDGYVDDRSEKEEDKKSKDSKKGNEEGKKD